MARGQVGPRFERLLVVEDDPRLRKTLCEALACHAGEVRCAATIGDASQQIALWRPELVVLDVVLPDGDAMQLIHSIPEHVPMPAFLAMSGAASRDQMLRLGQVGVNVYLDKPFDLNQVFSKLQTAYAAAPDMRASLRASVGRRPLACVEEEVRLTMVQEALSRTSGSTRGAARLLAVSRQMLQHFLRRISA